MDAGKRVQRETKFPRKLGDAKICLRTSEIRLGVLLRDGAKGGLGGYSSLVGTFIPPPSEGEQLSFLEIFSNYSTLLTILHSSGESAPIGKFRRHNWCCCIQNLYNTQ